MGEIRQEQGLSRNGGPVGSGSRDEAGLVAAAPLTTEQHLTRFYQELQAWVDRGAPNLDPFSDYHGICPNVDTWRRLAHVDLTIGEADRIRAELRRQFISAGLDENYPFNTDEGDYMREAKPYERATRLAWIKAHATGATITPTPASSTEQVAEQVSQPIRDAIPITPPSSSRGDQ